MVETAPGRLCPSRLCDGGPGGADARGHSDRSENRSSYSRPKGYPPKRALLQSGGSFTLLIPAVTWGLVRYGNSILLQSFP